MKKNNIEVAIVDDHEIVTQGIKSLLSNVPGIFVNKVFYSGEALLADIADDKFTYEVILLDLSLPGINGDEVLKRLISYQHRVSVVVLTSYSNAQMLKKLIDLGAKGFVLKTCSTKEIITAIEHAHRGRIFKSKEIEKILNTRVDKEPPFNLTPLEAKVAQLMCEGLNTQQIVDIAGLKHNTVKSYRRDIYKKINAHNLADLVKIAIKYKLFHLGIPTDYSPDLDAEE